MSFYPTTIGSAGSLTVSSGGTAVTGSGTSWANQVYPGDTLYNGSVLIGTVASVASNTALTLRAGANAAVSGATTWQFARTSLMWHSTSVANDFLSKIMARFDVAVGVTPGASGTLAQRAAYNAAAQGFTYLRTDVTPFELYAKVSATSGDWSSASTIQGAAGPQGVPGTQGVQGNTGATGSGWVVASGVPSSGVGANGDYGLNGSTGVIYLKVSGTWTSTGISIKGPQGDQGIQGIQGLQGDDGNDGADGRTLLNGSTDPSSGTGANGDFYLNTTTMYLFGPKSGGAWGSGVSLIPHPAVVTINASSSSVTLNMALARVFIINLSANVTSVTFSNWPAAGLYARCLVEIRNTGNFSFSHPSGVYWAENYAPSNTLGSGKRDRFIYDSLDGGSSKTGSIVGNNYSIP